MKNYQYSRVARAVAQALGNHSGLVGCALLAAGGTAWAQDNQAGEGTIDTVVVSGYRASLQNSIADKKDADQIVEAISAEDIGKLPDNSIAESIARVPGLTTQRLDGRAQVISIRGLAPDFSTTLLNGREQVTTGDNRSAEYDQYPSEVVGTVLVYKTPEAGLIGQGLSGTVDLQTIRPLEYGRRTLAANLRGERLSLGDLNAGSKEDGYRVSGTYVDQFADDRVGISVGVAYMDSPTQVERFNSWGYPGVTDGVVMGGAKPYVVSTELKRTGVIGTLEFAPSDTFTTSVDLYYSKFEDEQLLRGIELPLLWGGASLQPGYTTENGLVTEGVYTGVKAVVRNDANLREAELWSAGWNGKLDLGSWKLEGDLNFSTVDREDTILETYSGTGRAGVGATDDLGFNQSVDEGDATFSSSLDYSDPNVIFLTSPQGWGGNAIQGGQDGFINNPSIDDELTAFRLSAGREFGNVLFRNVEIGANYTLRDKTYRPDRYYLGLVGNTDGNTSIPIPQDALLRPTELEFLGISGMVSYDPLALAYGGMYNFVPAVDANVFSRNWAIEENVLTGYAQLGIEMDVGESVLSGNLGVQIVQTDQTSDGVGAANVPNAPFGTPAVVTPVSVEQDYTEALPSLNLSIRMPNDLVTRIGFARQMARPRMDDMRPSLEFTYDANRADETDINQSPWGGSGGNPNLRPWIANAVDLSVEKYYGREGYVAGAVFYKDLRSYIYNQPQLYDFTDFPITTGDDPVLRQGFVTTPQNGTGGKIYGYEIAGSLPFNTFAEALDGFGVIGSYSFTKSDISDPNSPSRPLPGLSEDVVSGTVYFEKFGFSARASVRHRSAFLGEVQGVGAERLLRSARAETLIDAQVSYDFQFGNLEGLSVILQGYNLTDEPFVTTELNNNNLVIDHQTFGRRYLLGVSVKY
jgi:iron complex outermembrane receptor protein